MYINNERYLNIELSHVFYTYNISCLKLGAANRKFPRKQTPWNSHRPTHDGWRDYNYNKSTSNAEEEEGAARDLVASGFNCNR